MPKISQSLPKYRKHHASGQAIVKLSGHDHYLGPHRTKVSRLEYDRPNAEWLAARQPVVQAYPAASLPISWQIVNNSCHM